MLVIDNHLYMNETAWYTKINDNDNNIIVV